VNAATGYAMEVQPAEKVPLDAIKPRFGITLRSLPVMDTGRGKGRE